MQNLACALIVTLKSDCWMSSTEPERSSPQSLPAVHHPFSHAATEEYRIALSTLANAMGKPPLPHLEANTRGTKCPRHSICHYGGTSLPARA
jgi:hypothetical protein